MVFPGIVKNSCVENNVNPCKARGVYKNLVKNLTGWDSEYQSTSKEPIQAPQEIPRLLYADFFCSVKKLLI